MKVSVVVPVFNTGPGIAALIDSLRAQTLPATEWEAVFVDDGSSDGTPDLVEGLIAGDANMRLLREAPSGWPGRPRNVGIDTARGDYVFFSDDDDTLAPEALARLTAFADTNGSDVVVPKTVGRNRQQQPDWHAYFDSIRACLDRVDEEAPDPERRRIMRSRWLRAEVISRLRGDGHKKLASPELLHEAHRLLLDRYDETDLAVLKPIDRTVADLLVAGRDEDVAAVARWESGLLVTTAAASAQVHLDGSARIELQATLTSEEALPDLPLAAGMLAQAAEFTRVGVELQHGSTKVRRLLRVEHHEGGLTVATTAAGEEPLENGKWTVIALAGEHRTRRRRAVDAAPALSVAATKRRVGAKTLEFEAGERLALRVRTYEAPKPVPLMVRVKRRVRRMIPSAIPTPRLRPAGS